MIQTIMTLFSIIFGLQYSGTTEFSAVNELASTQNFQFRPNLPLRWNVGDKVEYQLSLGLMGKVGTSIKSVTEETSNGYWVKQVFKIPFQTETVDVLISKDDGTVLRLVRNNKEQEIPDQKLEIISEKITQLAVPAGSFETLFVSGKTKDVNKLDLWVNASVVPIDGSLKQNFKISLGEVTMEMTRFYFQQ